MVTTGFGHRPATSSALKFGTVCVRCSHRMLGALAFDMPPDRCANTVLGCAEALRPRSCLQWAAGQNQPVGSVRRRPLEFHARRPGAAARRVNSSSAAPRGRPLLDPAPSAQVPPEKQLACEPLASSRRSPPEAAARRDMPTAGRSRELGVEGRWADKQAVQGSASKSTAPPHAGGNRKLPPSNPQVGTRGLGRSRQLWIRLLAHLRSDARPLGGGPAFPWVGEGLHGYIGAWRREGAR